MKHRLIIAACCLICMTVNMLAQQGKGSYASVSLHTGMSSLGYAVKGLDGVDGTTQDKIGLGVSLRYNYYFDSHFGFGTGIGLSIYNAEATLAGNLEDKNNLYALGNYKDDDNSGLPTSFALRARLGNIKEKQNIQFFEVPITLLYQTRFSYGKWGMYSSLGVKLQMPIVKRFEAVGNQGSQLNVSGLYTDPTQGFEIGAPGMPQLPEHGFGTIDNPGKALGWKNSTTDLKMGMAGTFELGLISRLNNESDFLIGAYIDYGLSDIKNKSIPLLAGPSGSYHPEANDNIGKGIIYNGLFNTSMTDKITPLSFGVKLGLRFKL